MTIKADGIYFVTKQEADGFLRVRGINSERVESITAKSYEFKVILSTDKTGRQRFVIIPILE